MCLNSWPWAMVVSVSIGVRGREAREGEEDPGVPAVVLGAEAAIAGAGAGKSSPGSALCDDRPGCSVEERQRPEWKRVAG